MSCPMCRTKLTPPLGKSAAPLLNSNINSNSNSINNTGIGGISIFNTNRMQYSGMNTTQVPVQIQEHSADDMRVMIRQAASRGRNAVQ